MIGFKPGRYIQRNTDFFWNRRLWVVRIGTEGIYLKAARGRWSGALFLPWAAAISVAAKMKASELKQERAERRRKKTP